MFKTNPALKVGQTVAARTPFGDFTGEVLAIAPTHSITGRPFAVAQFGVTIDVAGLPEELWALQEDVTILKEAE